MSADLAKSVHSPRRRLGGLADLYMRRRLGRDSHPVFKAIRDDRKSDGAPEPVPPAAAASDQSLNQSRTHETANTHVESEEDNSSVQEVYLDIEEAKKQFKEAMEAYENTTVGSKFKTDVTSRPVHTWEEVLEEAQKASDHYYDYSGTWGKIRKGLHSFGRNNKAFEAWSSALPSESHYFSLLCGGLKLIFGAAARLEDLRSDISDALAEIPILIATTHKAQGIFKQSDDLRQCSAELYLATITALHHIVKWYKEKASKRLRNSIFKQDSYETQLSDFLKAVRQQSDRFEKAARLCSYAIMSETAEIVKTHGDESRKYQEIALGYFDESKNEFQDFKRGFISAAGGVHQEVKSIGLQVSDMGEEVSQLRRILGAFLNSNDRMDFRSQDVRGPMLPMRKAVSESNLIKDSFAARDGPLSHFDYESSVVRSDMERSLDSIWVLTRADQDRTVAVMQSPKLHQWITESSSSALMVNFNNPKMKSSTSFIPAKLAHSIQSEVADPHYQRNVFALFFLCGGHAHKEDPDFGVCGMMRSLICQLLLSYPDFGMRIVRQIQRVDQDDISSLCELFHMMIAQIPRYITIFCILDAATVYEENRSLREEGKSAVCKLMDIVQWTRDNGCIFKVLLTSAWNSHVFYKYMPDQQKDVLWIPAKVPAQGGFTKLKWSSSIDPNVDKLRGHNTAF
ncbi:hypothetical protein FQN55_007344 [Onygenales sp. PD_40]|nr:hypothetical protein FQN55_007344 [Onygenales sp. PD_40]